MNATPDASVQRFEPNLQMAWGQIIVIAGVSAVVLSGLDYFKLAVEPSFTRAACVAVGVFAAAVLLFWFKIGRQGCQTVVLGESELTLETKDERAVLPWSELVEITLLGDSVLKFKSRNAREPLQLNNIGFGLEQWKAIKNGLQSRGYQFKTGYSHL